METKILLRQYYYRKNLQILSEGVKKAVISGELRGNELKTAEDLMNEIRDLVRIGGFSPANTNKVEIMLSQLEAIVVKTAPDICLYRCREVIINLNSDTDNKKKRWPPSWWPPKWWPPKPK